MISKNNDQDEASITRNSQSEASIISPSAGLADVVHDVARGVLDARLRVLKVLDLLL